MFQRRSRDSARPLVILVIAAALISMFVLGCQRVQREAETPAPSGAVMPASSSMDPVAHGKYIVMTSGCNDCHTPWKMGAKGPEPDTTRFLSGHPQEMKMPPAPKLAQGPWMWTGAATMSAYSGPWGVSYAFNLTPDDETGIGVWSEDVFIKAMRTGTDWHGTRPILPPMPWQNLARMTDPDLKAVFAYLKSIPPIKNQVPEPVVSVQ